METDDLKLIKKYYGEKMSRLCRDLFPTILEQKGFLFDIISKHFTKSKSLYYDIINENKESLFKEYIFSFFDDEKNNKKITTKKSARELLAEQEYDLYECKSFEDVLKFQKYYDSKEKLCTFRDPKRIEDHHIFFIVKKDVENIKREDFKNPTREDEYGVSVLDLQFDKGNRQRVSIKSRYNHRVRNPDATYSNNLESIAPGLTEAFKKDYGFNIVNANNIGFELEDYIEARDGKNYKYNYEINNIHYCLDNIIIDNGKVIDTYTDKSRYTFMDYFILDESEKRIIIYDKRIRDSFVDDFQDIESIDIRNNNEEGYKEITLKQKGDKKAIIKLDKRGRIIGYKNDYLKTCYDNFLYYNKSIANLDLPNLEFCDSNFLYYNNSLKTLKLPMLEECVNYFLSRNNSLITIDLPRLEYCGKRFLGDNDSLSTLYLPNLKKCGENFLNNNISLKTIDLPELEECRDHFIDNNKYLKSLNMPKLEKCNDDFFSNNRSLETLDLPKLKKCGDDFFKNNESLITLNMPKLEECGNYFFINNKSLKTLDLPNLKKCGHYFFRWNTSINTLDLPKLEECEEDFLFCNRTLITLELANLKRCSNNFLRCNETIKTLKLPFLKSCGSNFLLENDSLMTLDLPNLKRCGDSFLYGNKIIVSLNLPELKECGHCFLYRNTSIKKFNLSKLEHSGSDFLYNNQSLSKSLNIPKFYEFRSR